MIPVFVPVKDDLHQTFCDPCACPSFGRFFSKEGYGYYVCVVVRTFTVFGCRIDQEACVRACVLRAECEAAH